MKLEDFVGNHFLSGVELSTQKKHIYGSKYEDCGVILFIIDGVTYKAVEDPDDGYRSYLDDLSITDEKIKNTFPSHEVIGRMKEDENYEKNDIIQFIDVTTNKIVLEIGTGNTNNYYPYCVFEWNPQNLAINIGKPE